MVPAVGACFTVTVITFDALLLAHVVSRLKSVDCVIVGELMLLLFVAVVNVDHAFWPAGLDCQVKVELYPEVALSTTDVLGQVLAVVEIVPGEVTVTFNVTVSISNVCVGPGYDGSYS